MQKLVYYWSKALRKLRGPAILHSQVHQTSKIEAGTSFIRSDMRKYSFCGYDCEISDAEIGSFTSIANYVVIGGGIHPMDWVGMSPVFYAGRDSVTKKFAAFDRPPSKRVVVGSDVWIGFRAIIMQGVTIGHGAVVGAGAVVTADVPPYAIVAGTPAKIIRYRFDENTRSRLLASEWWNKPDEVLEQCSDAIRSPDLFLERLQSCG